MGLATPFTSHRIINWATEELKQVRDNELRVNVVKATRNLAVDTVINTLTLPIFLGLSFLQFVAEKIGKNGNLAERFAKDMEWARFSNLPRFIARIFAEAIATPLTLVGLVKPAVASKIHQGLGLVEKKPQGSSLSASAASAASVPAEAAAAPAIPVQEGSTPSPDQTEEAVVTAKGSEPETTKAPEADETPEAAPSGSVPTEEEPVADETQEEAEASSSNSAPVEVTIEAQQ